MDLLDWNWWIKEKKNSLFFERARPHLQNHLARNLYGDWKDWQGGFCSALESEPPWLSFSALAGRGRWWRLFKQLLCANGFLVGKDTLTLGPPASPAQKASLCHCGPDVTLTFLFFFASSWIKPTSLFLFLFSSGCLYRTGPRKDACLNTNIREKHLCEFFVFLNIFRSHKPAMLLFYALLGWPQILGTEGF